MPTVIDSLVVELGFDAKNIADGEKAYKASRQRIGEEEKKVDQEQRKRESEATERTRRATDTAIKLRNQIVALFAVFTAGRGIKEFVSDIIASDSALGRLSLRLDTSAGTLAAWRGAGAMVGATAADIYGSFQNLTTQLQQFSVTGESSVIPYFRAMGISLVDADGKARQLNDVFLDMAKWGQGKDPARAAFFFQQAGVSEGMANLLLQGPDVLRQSLALQRQYAPTADDIRAATEMQKSLATLEFASTKLGRTLQTQVEPYFAKFVGWLVKAADWLEQNPGVLDGIAIGLAAIGTAITVGLGAAAIGVAVDGLLALGGAFVALSGVMLATPFGWVLLGIAALVAAGYYLVEHWNEIKAWWQQLWRDMRDATLAPSAKGVGRVAGDLLLGASPALGPIFGPLARVGAAYLGSTAPGSGVPVAGRALLDTIAGTESGGAYNVEYGGQRFSSYADHPNRANLITRGPNAGRTSSAAGRYQMLYGTWLEAKTALGLKDFSPESQDRAAWWVAQRNYRAHTGRDLLTDLNSGDPRLLAGVGSALSSTWTSLPSGIEATQSSRGFVSSIGAKTAALSTSSNSSNVSTRTTHIGTVVVNTNATDADGVARGLSDAMERNSFAAQADYGPG